MVVRRVSNDKGVTESPSTFVFCWPLQDVVVLLCMSVLVFSFCLCTVLISSCVASKRLCFAIVITKTRLFKYTENFTTKNENFQIKNSDIFHISAQNIDCGYSLEPPRRGGSNEYPQSMFLSRNKNNNVCPCKPQFYYIKVGFNGGGGGGVVKII